MGQDMNSYVAAKRTIQGNAIAVDHERFMLNNISAFQMLLCRLQGEAYHDHTAAFGWPLQFSLLHEIDQAFHIGLADAF